MALLGSEENLAIFFTELQRYSTMPPDAAERWGSAVAFHSCSSGESWMTASPSPRSKASTRPSQTTRSRPASSASAMLAVRAAASVWKGSDRRSSSQLVALLLHFRE